MLHIPMDIVNSLRFIKIGTLAHWPIISFLYQSHHVKERLFFYRLRGAVTPDTKER